MKLKILLLSIVLSLNMSSFAYFTGSEWLVSAGVSYGYHSYLNYKYDGYSSIILPPLTFQIEKGFHEYLSIGCYMNYQYRMYRFDYDDVYFKRYGHYAMGGVLTFHGTPIVESVLEMELDNIDFYGSLKAGMIFQFYETNRHWKEDKNIYITHSDFSIWPRIGPSAGCRYYVDEKLAFFCEVGFGTLGIGTLGVTLRL